LKLRLAGILSESIVDGPGVRFVVFAQGCLHHCPGCHNKATWDTKGGEVATVKEILKKIKRRVKYIRGITLSGGEPFLQAEEMAQLAYAARKLGLDIITYTGYVYEELLQIDLPGSKDLLGATDMLIEGPFILAKKDISLQYRGSSNQRIIDLSKNKEQRQACNISYMTMLYSS
jgi:anaerobic ribonucleoside-triphosphate reductase activating protein